MAPIGMEPSSSLWRTRDAAQDLLERSKDTKTAMTVSTSFDVDTCLARLRRDKAAVVRASFDAAALTVVHAMKKQDEQQVEAGKTFKLPPLVEQWQELQVMRVNSMKRAHDNKEIRKTKSIDVASSATTGSAKVAKSAADTKKTSSDAPKAGTSSTVTMLANPGAATAESRATVSRAVLCTAASIAFDELTPTYSGHDIDIVDVPQNTSRANDAEDTQPPPVNMGAVLLQAQTLGQRAASLAENAARRSRQRYQYRRDNARYQKSPRSVFQVSNPFASKSWSTQGMEVDDEEDMADEIMTFPPPSLSDDSVTEEWKSYCLPRLMTVLDKGSGHAVYCDVEWPTRHGRIAHLLEQLADKTRGPHLIVTTQPEVEAFAQQFDSLDCCMRLVPTSSLSEGLRVLTYTGSKSHRRELRQHFASATGLPESPFHVMVTSYTVFLQDYLHLCQLPYQVVLLDEGWSWLAAAQVDPNSSMGALWENSIWSSNDHHIGLAGTMQQDWDFSDDDFTESRVKNACIGLTAQHRIITTPSVSIGLRDSRNGGPVAGLVNFLLPQFTDVVREEWDRCRINADGPSMDHMRKLVTRSIIVYHPTGKQNDLYQLALDGLAGLLPAGDKSQDPEVPVVIEDDTFVSQGKFSQSRRSALACFGPSRKSWMRYELGKASFQSIMEDMKGSRAHGHVCEEVVTASSLTSSGAAGTVSGTMAYRLAVRCGRSFGSEQGLRQHMAANHAPPGTWLCRTCGSDCGTSQARTHHERTCGQPPGGAPSGGSEHGSNAAGGSSTVGQGVRSNGKMNLGGAGGKKGNAKKSGAAVGAVGAAGAKDKDSDGSFRVPGYRGVWVNPSGKHFVKIDGERLTEESGDGDEEGGGSGEVLFFDTIENAAKKHDEVILEMGKEKTTELNFNEDGSRIVYEDSTPAAAGLEMLGGGASSVVPALSVINIKDLPKDVKPLLRDPRQTSRTGGNSKRHVYAYRGVCRQARKGHDRWQSQISFAGVNHYLGTFDSEWDAAAIYAWAHLILYGEEATRQAQKEGEEAAAAYEQEKRDIAAGKIIVPPPKPAKKKKTKSGKADATTDAGSTQDDGISKTPEKAEGKESDKPGSSGAKPKKKRVVKESQGSEKKPKVSPRPSTSKTDISSLAPVLAKGVVKVPVLAPRKAFEAILDSNMTSSVATRLNAARSLQYCVSDANIPAPVTSYLRPCAPVTTLSSRDPSGGALLVGLSSVLFGWNVEGYLSANLLNHEVQLAGALSQEYNLGGYNDSFRTVLQGTVCLIGRASKRTERAWKSLGLGPLPLGGTVGELDCNIGGYPSSCSEAAATIAYCPSGGSDFQFCASNDDDVVTLNGQQIKMSMGSFPLFNEDICTVGARAFVFVLPTSP